MSATTETHGDLRQQAIERLQKRSEFWAHAAAFVLVNTLLIILWVAVSDGGFFWPMFPLLGWGIGLFFHGLEVFRRPFTPERIRREMERLDPDSTSR